MKHLLPLALAALTCAPCLAQEAAAKTAAPPTGEPAVRRSVVEDSGARIEELRVRGQVQRISVTTKLGGTGHYEIIPADGARDMSDGASSTRGAAGKRVWNLMSF
jgi:hypothetical protein